MDVKSFALASVIVLVVGVFLAGCTNSADADQESVSTGFPNPASVKCLEDGYELETRTDDAGNQYGICVAPDGKECPQWDYYRGDCKL